MPRLPWLEVVACAGQLVVAVAAFAQLARNRRALGLGLFATSMAGWTFASAMFDVTGFAPWHWLDVSLSPWSLAFGVLVLLEFIGQRRRLIGLFLTCAAGCGIISALSLSAFVWDVGRAFVDSAAWSASMAGVAVPSVGAAGWLSWRHWREAHDDIERARTGIFLASLVVMTLLGGTELLSGLGVDVPHLGSVASGLTAATLAVAVLRFESPDLPVLTRAAFIVIAATAAALAGAILYGAFKNDVALASTGLAVVVAVGGFVARAVSVRTERHRQQLHAMASLGRLSAQLAHDLKNPLAALRGAAQYLDAAGQRTADEREFLALMVAQVDRMSGIIERYQRLGRMELMRERVDLTALLDDVVNAGLAGVNPEGPNAVKVEWDVPATPCFVSADKLLLRSVVENVVSNALHAMADGGTLHVLVSDDAGAFTATLHDTGGGMDARTLERATDDFFTTKASGSGLGLSLARRVMHAHGGRISLESAKGQGTTVRLHFAATEQAS
ncbi:MAG: HAMP domain-containing histidine kinase [Archangium sp.]|nr:HAMP domain-containing histidine kinase [Archangium sp.]